jgi:hypothetical protein
MSVTTDVPITADLARGAIELVAGERGVQPYRLPAATTSS